MALFAISLLGSDIEDFDDDVEQENLWSQPPLIAPALEELTLGESFIILFDAPRLRHLSLRLALDSASVGYAIDTIQSCSTIEHLELHNGFDGLFECSPDQCDIPILSLPHLRYLVMDPCEPHFIYHLQSTRHLNIKISSGSRDSLFCSMANMRLRDLFVYDTTEFILSSTGQTLVLDREFIAFPEGFHKIIPPHQICHITVIRNTLSGYEKAIYSVTKSLVSLKIRPTLDSPKLCDIPFLESDDDSSFPSLQTLEIDMTQEGELHAVDRSKRIDWSKGRDRRSKPESQACRLEVIQPELQERLWDAIVHFLSMRRLQTLILAGKRPVVREPRTAAEVKLVANDTEKLEHIGRLVGEVVDQTEPFYVVDLARDADQVRNAGILVDESMDLRRMKRWIGYRVGRKY